MIYKLSFNQGPQLKIKKQTKKSTEKYEINNKTISKNKKIKKRIKNYPKIIFKKITPWSKVKISIFQIRKEISKNLHQIFTKKLNRKSI